MVLEEMARKMSNLLSGRRLTVDEKVNYGKLVEILSELPAHIEVKVKYGNDVVKENYLKRGPEVAKFLLQEFFESNSVVYLEAKHQVFADTLQRKHYFDLKLGLEFAEKESIEDKSLPLKEATISYLKKN